MTKWKFAVGQHLIVEADTEEEAWEKAEKAPCNNLELILIGETDE